MRTHACGELRARHEEDEVRVAGWVQRRRDHGGLIFVDLRDRSGVVQVVFNPEYLGTDLFHEVEGVRGEFVITVCGKVGRRLAGMENPNLDTGEIEVIAQDLTVLNAASPPPFPIDRDTGIDESLRLRYRYLDLRRPEMQESLALRHKVTQAIRRWLDGEGFYEIETPMLTRSTPEGARDYLVPSRLHPGSFYALPQSPQLFKQLLMVSGMERYFQIVRCFRDEDLRADRQPEFTQLDMEMSFVRADDVMQTVEALFTSVFRETAGLDLASPVARLSYDEAMDRYGSDKPDLRFDLPLVDVSREVGDSGFRVFSGAVASGGVVKGINAGRFADGWPRREIDNLSDAAQQFGAKGLAWVVFGRSEPKSPIAKFLAAPDMDALGRAMGAVEGDLLLFVADERGVANEVLGRLRSRLAERLELIDPAAFSLCWVVDWPLFEWDEEAGRFEAMHHPFTAPKEADLPLLDSEPGRVKAEAYDLVLNGVELGGGSIRIHRRETQARVFEAMGISAEQAQDKFGFLMEAFDYGAPPHGGIAFGLDRLVMLISGRDSIRDVIAFPKTQKATCLMTGAPSEADERQLHDLSLRLDPEVAALKGE